MSTSGPQGLINPLRSAHAQVAPAVLFFPVGYPMGQLNGLCRAVGLRANTTITLSLSHTHVARPTRPFTGVLLLTGGATQNFLSSIVRNHTMYWFPSVLFRTSLAATLLLDQLVVKGNLILAMPRIYTVALRWASWLTPITSYSLQGG